MKAVLSLTCLIAIVVLTISTSSTSASSYRMKRSVNFTPSWGKRSGGYDVAPRMMMARQGLEAAASDSDKCAGKELYLEMLIDTLKVSNFVI
jgi:hypothetical protein